MSDTGRIEPVLDYRFNSREGRDLIRLAASRLGLKETMPGPIKKTLLIVGILFLLALALDVWGLIYLPAH